MALIMIRCEAFVFIIAALMGSAHCQTRRCIPPEAPCGQGSTPCKSRSCAKGNRVVYEANFAGLCYCPYGNLVNSANICVPVAGCDGGATVIGNLVNSIPPQPSVNPFLPNFPNVPNVVQPTPFIPNIPNNVIQPNPFIPNTVVQPPTFLPNTVVNPQNPFINQGVIQPPPQTQIIQQPLVQPINQGITATIQPLGTLPIATNVNNTIGNQQGVLPAPIFTTILTDLGRDPVVYQLYHPGKYDHLYTRSKTEIMNAVREGYVLEKELGRMVTNRSDLSINCPEELLVPMQRWFQPLVSDHYYTIKPNDSRILGQNGFNREGNLGMCVNGYVCGATIPLHQFYNDQLKDHYYTTYLNDFERVLNGTVGGYSYQGVQCYIWE